MLYKLVKNIGLFVLGAMTASLVFILLFGELYKYRQLDTVLSQVSAAPYDGTNYNCVDFSEDAQNKLSEKNIASNIIVVKKDASETHALVSVWFDPQNGSFAPKSEYLGDYTELKTKFGWAN